MGNKRERKSNYSIIYYIGSIIVIISYFLPWKQGIFEICVKVIDMIEPTLNLIFNHSNDEIVSITNIILSITSIIYLMLVFFSPIICHIIISIKLLTKRNNNKALSLIPILIWIIAIIIQILNMKTGGINSIDFVDYKYSVIVAIVGMIFTIIVLKQMKSLIIYIVLILFSAVALYPVLRVLAISLRPGDNLLTDSLSIIPIDATFENYVELFQAKPFLLWLRNSFLVTAMVTILGVVLASTAGYAFSRYDFPGRKAGLMSLLVTQMFPATMLLLPLYIMIAKLHLVNSMLGLVVMYSATALPFCIWMMKGYYDTIPISLEESALVDGAGRFRSFVTIMLPLAAPALVITALFSFMSAWNEYIVAAQVMLNDKLFTLPVGLKSLQGNMSTEWGMYAAGSLLVSIPVVILFLSLSRWLVSGLTLGSVKG